MASAFSDSLMESGGAEISKTTKGRPKKFLPDVCDDMEAKNKKN